MGLLTLLKALLSSWPFLKELLIGGKNHPFFKDRANQPGALSKKNILIIILIIIMGNALHYLYMENKTLNETVSNQTPVRATTHDELRYSEYYLEYRLCSNNLEISKKETTEMFERYTNERDKHLDTMRKYEEALKALAEANNRNTPQPRRESLRDAALKQLEQLKRGEG